MSTHEDIIMGEIKMVEEEEIADFEKEEFFQGQVNNSQPGLLLLEEVEFEIPEVEPIVENGVSQVEEEEEIKDSPVTSPKHFEQQEETPSSPQDPEIPNIPQDSEESPPANRTFTANSNDIMDEIEELESNSEESDDFKDGEEKENPILPPKHPSAFLDKLEFLNVGVDLMTHEMLKKSLEERRKIERRRRTTANPKYNSNGFIDPSVALNMRRSRRNDDSDSGGNRFKKRSIVELKPKEDLLRCFVCQDYGCNLTCGGCLTKFHALCIRVGGSKAPIINRVDICPNCIQNRPKSESDTPSRGVSGAESGSSNGLKLKRAKHPKSRFSNLKLSNIFSAMKSKIAKPRHSSAKSTLEKIKMKQKGVGGGGSSGGGGMTNGNGTSKSSPRPGMGGSRLFSTEKQMSEDDLKKTIISMTEAAKYVLESSNSSILNGFSSRASHPTPPPSTSSTSSSTPVETSESSNITNNNNTTDIINNESASSESSDPSIQSTFYSTSISPTPPANYEEKINESDQIPSSTLPPEITSNEQSHSSYPSPSSDVELPNEPFDEEQTQMEITQMDQNQLLAFELNVI